MSASADCQVECYSGVRHSERPVAVVWQGERLLVTAVKRQWHTPAGPGFEVLTAGSRRFRLQLDERTDCWQVSLLAGNH